MSATLEELALVDAFIDKELDGEQARGVARLLEERADLKAYADRQRRLKLRLDAAFSDVISQDAPEHLVEAARSTPMPIAQAPARQRAAHTGWRALPIAAAVVLGLGLGLYLGANSSPSLIRVGSNGSAMAKGALAAALTNQLAAEENAAIGIGLSFRNKSGRMCRTFATSSLAGIACRENAGWSIADLTASETPQIASDKFQPAGAALPQTLRDRVKAMIEGDVLDAAGERAARDSNWQR